VAALVAKALGIDGGVVSVAWQVCVLQLCDDAGLVAEQKLSATVVPPLLQLTVRVCVPPPQVFEQELQVPVLQA
jgi:hypothetical protein